MKVYHGKRERKMGEGESYCTVPLFFLSYPRKKKGVQYRMELSFHYSLPSLPFPFPNYPYKNPPLSLPFPLPIPTPSLPNSNILLFPH